jgi:hypothetical protein
MRYVACPLGFLLENVSLFVGLRLCKVPVYITTIIINVDSGLMSGKFTILKQEWFFITLFCTYFANSCPSHYPLYGRHWPCLLLKGSLVALEADVAASLGLQVSQDPFWTVGQAPRQPLGGSPSRLAQTSTDPHGTLLEQAP